MSVTEKCIMCGLKSTRWCPKVGKNVTKYGSVFSAWNDECATTLCQVLFGSSDHLYLNYFQEIFDYCSSCQRTVRDINLTWRQISALQSRLKYLSDVVKRRLHGNFLCVTQNDVDRIRVNEGDPDPLSDENKINSRSSWDEERDSISYNNVVKLIYEAVIQGGEIDSLSGSVSSAGNFNVKNVKMEVEVDVFQNHDDEFENSDFEQTSSTFKNRAKRKSASAALMKFKSRNRSYSDDESISDNESISNNSDGSSSEPDYSEKGVEYSTREDDDNSFQENKGLIKTEKKPSSKKIRTEGNKIPGGKSKDPETLAEKKRLARERKNAKRRIWRQLIRSGGLAKRRTIDCTVEGCKAKLKGEESLQNHIKAMHSGEKKPFECPKCLKRFTRLFTLKKHHEENHTGLKAYDHYCKFCGKRYPEESELQAHYASSHPVTNPFSCAFCDKVFTNGTLLRMHMEFDHPEEDKPLCAVCGKKFTSKVTLAAHSRYHADPDSLFKCPICNFLTISASALKIHVERHNTEKKYTCEVCGKSFTSKMSLRSHADVHAEKKYKCKVCDMAFANNMGCRRHEVTHTGIKEHVCQSCGRAFTHRRNLKDHEKIHLRESGIDIPMRKQRSKKRNTHQQIVHSQEQPLFFPASEMFHTDSSKSAADYYEEIM